MKLAKREKLLLGLTVVAAGAFFLMQFLVFPFLEERGRMVKGVEAKERSLEEIVKLSAVYRLHKRDSRGAEGVVARREKDFTLFSFLEKMAGKANVKDYITYMKPSVSHGSSGPYRESMIEMQLEKISLKQLVAYLYRIESPENLVSVKRLSVKENKRNPGYLDAILQVFTLTPV
jgi:general secretion pathway protein M